MTSKPERTHPGSETDPGPIRALAAVALLFLAGVGRAASDAGPAAAPATIDDSGCEKCHGKLIGKKTVHGVLAAGGGCTECHAAGPKEGKCQNPGVRAWKISAAEPALCVRCHDVSGKGTIHPVIESMGCTACHDPHSTDNPKMLKIWPAVDLCYSCHDKKDTTKTIHTAVKKGDCLGCHEPHYGDAPPLLRKKREELCFRCHKPEALLPRRVHHVPVIEGRCLECHDPHGSAFPKQTLKEGKELCLKCHDVKARAGMDRPRGALRVDLKAKGLHAALDVGDCQDCHEAGHSSDNKKLLKKVPPDLCYGCHDRKDGERFTHGAIRLGDCAVCHHPHAAENPMLLRSKVPRELCFRCHQDDVTGRTFVHKPVADGNCTACHNPHGSPNPWNLKAGEGKKVCYTCHKPKDEVKVKHRALDRYGCTACHDPHGTANRFQLLKPVNELCQTCHKDKMDGMHASTFVPGGHKISADFDPRRTDREFSCASCHDPHGSDNPKLFYFGGDEFEMCDGCHGDRTGKHKELKDIHRNKKPKAGPDGGVGPVAPVAPPSKPDAGPLPAYPAADAGTPAAGPPKGKEDKK